VIDLEPASAPPSVDSRFIDPSSDSELDSLPYGVIALDPRGVVLRYNLYESRLARLDKNQVIGRNFFAEVARCTRTDEFYGRFERLLAAGNVGSSERFDFVFGFAFGEQQVAIEMLLAAPGKIYLLVNRKSVRAERTQSPDVPLAVLQRALAPDEAAWGVRRDPMERRFVDVSAPFFAALRATCDRVAPESWQLFATEWGVQWGRRAAIDLEAWAIEQGRSSLRDVPMQELASLVAAAIGDRGWGRPSFHFEHANEGIVVIAVERSALAEAAPKSHVAGAVGPPRDLACHLLAGCFSGLMTYVADRRLSARELSCRSSGAPRCTFALVSHERRRVVDTALLEGHRGVDAIRDALRRSSSIGPGDGAASR
jgi:photoactive yellow protein